ncbi:MAG: phosphate signaling complex protein PhoU [Dehalococcoidales bacterium]|nr:phosphate signaling complex protein PhoU [Dehalococcoidales bacterium]
MEIRANYRKHLREIQDDVLMMGSMVTKSILQSIEALKNRERERAEDVIKNDLKVDKLRYDIEDRCVQLIATQQPMASDLRVIISVLNIISELERIGDHAEGTAKITLLVGDEPPLKPLVDLPRMAEKSADMLRRSLDAFIHRDAAAAREIIKEDDEVDALYNQVFRELLSFMAEDPKTISRATRLIWVAHNLERSGDRVTNICERIVYLVTGDIEDLEISKY